MIVGPGWKGETPKGVKAVFQSETEFAYILFRTQLFNPADLDNGEEDPGRLPRANPSASI
jgi:hypothetical protein